MAGLNVFSNCIEAKWNCVFLEFSIVSDILTDHLFSNDISMAVKQFRVSNTSDIFPIAYISFDCTEKWK